MVGRPRTHAHLYTYTRWYLKRRKKKGKNEHEKGTRKRSIQVRRAGLVRSGLPWGEGGKVRRSGREVAWDDTHTCRHHMQTQTYLRAPLCFRKKNEKRG